MKIKCTNKKCGYEWDYNGKGKFYATCPKCLYKVRINPKKKNETKSN